MSAFRGGVLGKHAWFWSRKRGFDSSPRNSVIRATAGTERAPNSLPGDAVAPVPLPAHLLVRISLGLPHRRPELSEGLHRVALPAPLRLGEPLRLPARPSPRVLA